MSWIEELKGLPDIVAVLVVFTGCVYLIIRSVSRHIVDPLRHVITNHFDHDREDRKEDRKVREEQITAFRDLTQEIKIAIRGGEK